MASITQSQRRISLSLKAGVVACLLVLLSVTTASAVAVSPAVRAASVTASGRTDAYFSKPSSREVAISSDGRFVAFASYAPNLVAGDTNGQQDIFVRDRQLAATTRVSMSHEGAQVAKGRSSRPSISGDGRFVAFTSASAEIVVDDTNGVDDVFLHDRQTGKTIRVSVESDGSQLSTRSDYPSVSGDGRYVAFVSYVRVELDGGYDKGVIYVRDTSDGSTALVSKSSEGVQGNEWCGPPAISGNGRYVAFPSGSTNLVPGGPSEASIYVHDTVTGATTRESVNNAGMQGPSPDESSRTTDCSLSDDGRFVAFMSTSTNLVAGDTNEAADIFVRDRQLGKTTRVNISSSGAQAKGWSYGPKLSADGRFVAFISGASNLVSWDTNKKYDVFLHNRSARSTRRVSVSYDGAQANGASGVGGTGSSGGFACDVSDSGRLVAFYSAASNLVPRDVNYRPDVFVRDMSATWKARTFLTLTASPTTMKAYGDSAVLTGTLRKRSPTGARFGGAKVAVQRYYSDGWRTIKTVRTSSTGRVRTTVTPSRTGAYRLRYKGVPGTYAAAESPKRTIYAKARLGTPTAKHISGREYRLSSAMRPRHTAGLTSLVRVYFAKYENGRWISQYVGTRGYLKAKVYDSGDYSAARVTFTFPAAGRWRVRFVHLDYDCHLKSKSPYAYMTVK